MRKRHRIAQQTTDMTECQIYDSRLDYSKLLSKPSRVSVFSLKAQSHPCVPHTWCVLVLENPTAARYTTAVAGRRDGTQLK